MAEVSNVNVPLTGLRTQPNALDGDPQTSLVQGTLRGETFTARVGGSSFFQSVQEEIGFSIAERASAETSRKQAKDAAKVQEVFELIEKYLKKVNDLERKDLNNFASNLNQQNTANLRQLLIYAQQQFKDVAHQYVALLYSREYLKKRLRGRGPKGKGKIGKLLALVEDAIAQYETDEKSAIDAGLNVTNVATTHAQNGLDSVQGLRNFYRDAVLDYAGLSHTYRHIASQYGTQDLPKAIDYLLQGLAADMAAQGSSIDKSKLQQIVADMYQLRVVNSVYFNVVDMLSLMR